ncbi:MAG: hypothetical protein KGQ93_08040 [Cyanobacteria bacterium REEB459]|nr:hypothetical protein [Cyanobacteria bacterium REEB459]
MPVQPWFPPSPVDRLESVKVALLTGSLGALVGALISVLHRIPMMGWQLSLASTLSGLAGNIFIVTVAIAALSTSLFGITYRYAIRQDPNPQIKIGVVLAFTLVRGLTLIDAAVIVHWHSWPLILISCSESLLLFGLTAAGLELALNLGWVHWLGAERS